MKAQFTEEKKCLNLPIVGELKIKHHEISLYAYQVSEN